MCLKANLFQTAKNYGLVYKREEIEFSLLTEYLRHRFNFFKDDWFIIYFNLYLEVQREARAKSKLPYF